MEFDWYPHYFNNDLDTEEDYYKSTGPSEDIWKKFELSPTPPMSPARTPSGGSIRVLGQEEEEGQPPPDTDRLSSIIIRDCMWSSFSASKQPEKVRVPVAAQQAVVPPAAKICRDLRPSKAQCVSPLSSLAPDCVDPAAVLSIPARKPASSGSESRSDSSGKKKPHPAPIHPPPSPPILPSLPPA